MRIRSTLHHLLDEIHLLTTGCPDLRDAFDADELPIAFILELFPHATAGRRRMAHSEAAASRRYA